MAAGIGHRNRVYPTCGRSLRFPFQPVAGIILPDHAPFEAAGTFMRV